MSDIGCDNFSFGNDFIVYNLGIYFKGFIILFKYVEVNCRVV